jgi:superfamily II DNA or RNA helicase
MFSSSEQILTNGEFDERAALSKLLDDLEDLELPLLAWGVTTGTLSEEEVEAIVDKHLPSWPLGTMVDEVVEKLVDAALLFEIPASSPRKYRTRAGETIRLVAMLRQLFPLNTPTAQWWERRPTLVADYRLHVVPRRYPKREIHTSDAINELSEVEGWSVPLAAVAQAAIIYPTLARFQIDAAKSILTCLAVRDSRGVIVGAGTGSGKTMAFYVPAFVAMAAHARAGRTGVHTLALYPRNELLRDQLREAVGRMAGINAVQVSAGARQLRVGVLYGDTPYNNTTPYYFGAKGIWRQGGNGRVCPYLKCPDCRQDLIWTDADRKAGRERLECSNTQRRTVIEQLVLTRHSLKANPPDLLFTTTEMLNRNSTDMEMGALLGWRGSSSPALVLLDEAHTYAGIHGAQVALLLRRWRYALQRPPVFVGLSATLRDAAEFFAQLTGLPRLAVEHIESVPEDMLEEGREYSIALRTDPVSQASVLSTTIQAAMLFGRVLDLPGQVDLFGSRGFLFTDDLDVTNRLFHDLTHAEGDRGRTPVLAGLRSKDAPFRPERFADGQSWDLVQSIGRELDPAARAHGLRVSLTSSQSAGVSQDSDLVVATASLEVGFDDDRVGLVVQHKAPRDPSSFIQRRGRAGRSRGTRPWTVVTLTDYGRDRLTYQSYDTLFAPELPARKLPVGNRFILKIQAAHALLNWLSLRTGLNTRDIVTAPQANGQQASEADQKAVTAVLTTLLDDAALRADLRSYLCACLQIDVEDADALLWDSPRSILLGVVPTIVRRLERRWAAYGNEPGSRPNSVLPEFVTRTLFEGLNVPEVSFNVDFLEDDPARRIENALREAVPGKVSLRYGYHQSGQRTWLPLPDPEDQPLDVSVFLDEYSEEGEWTPSGEPPIRVLRPLTIHLHEPPPNISDQSQGMARWTSQFVEPAPLNDTIVPRSSPWHRRISAMAFGTGAVGNPIEVRRMTAGADCTIKTTGRTADRELSVSYAKDDEPVALGFSLSVDAVRFDLAPLDVTTRRVIEYLQSPQWRSFAFNAALQEDPSLDGHANNFQRRWLTLVYTTAFALEQINNPGCSTQQVHAVLTGGAWRDSIAEVLNAIYRGDAANAQARLVTTLTELADDVVVTDAVDRHGRLLWSHDVLAASTELVQKTYRDTIAGAIRAATQRACPDAQDTDLIIDVLPPEANGTTTMWLTETALGGLGIITKFVHYYAIDPPAFWHLVDGVLGDSDHEYVRDTVNRLLIHIIEHPQSVAAQAMKRLRSPRSATEADAALRDLRRAWAHLDAPPRHPAVAALSSRYLRPGSDERTDRLVLELTREWNELEQRLGFEVDGGILAYLAGTGAINVPGLAALGFGTDQVYSLLVPRGAPARTQHLMHYQPYSPNPLLDPLLARAAHDEQLPAIDVSHPDWARIYVEYLTEEPRVLLSAEIQDLHHLTSAIREVPAITIDRDVLRLHGTVGKLARGAGRVEAVVEIPEATQ